MSRLLKQFWQKWLRLARRIGEWQSRIILTVLYLILVGPLTLIVRARDPLGARRPLTWQPYHGRSADLPAARRQ